MQYVIPIYEKWDPEIIFENIELLRSEIKWKNFKLTYDAKTYEDKGYFVIHFSYDKPVRKSSIIIYWNKVELTSKDWRDIYLASVLLGYLLKEEKKNIFLDSLYRDYKKTGEFNRQFQKLVLEAMVSQYLDLAENRVPARLVQITKEMVRLTLENMLQVIGEI